MAKKENALLLKIMAVNIFLLKWEKIGMVYFEARMENNDWVLMDNIFLVMTQNYYNIQA